MTHECIEAEPIHCRGPDGSTMTIADKADDEPIFEDPEDPLLKKWYDEQGYVVLRRAISPAVCQRINLIYQEQIKSNSGLFYRQTASGLAERHRMNERGHMMNALLNIHDFPSRECGDFRRTALDIFCSQRIQSAVRNLLSEAGVLVQTMYFEGNPATWAHQDTYYLDATDLGRLTACWIALEDIAPGAGRFYVYPRSHQLAMKNNSEEINFSFRHEEYKRHVLEQIQANRLELRAPALKVGDVLFWNSRTIHGSLETVQSDRTRRSLTAHFIPTSTGFLQFQSRKRSLCLESFNGMKVHHPKDLDRMRPRLVLWVEGRFPSTYKWIRRLAIRYFTG